MLRWRILCRAWVVKTTCAESRALCLICVSSCRADGEATLKTYHFDRSNCDTGLRLCQPKPERLCCPPDTRLVHRPVCLATSAATGNSNLVPNNSDYFFCPSITDPDNSSVDSVASSKPADTFSAQ